MADHKKLLIYTDGGSRGNPGIAGSGTVVYSTEGETLAEIAYVVGKKATNNVAEYHGMLRGLEAARDLGARELEIRMDSKLVVEQMSGRWKIKHPDMQALALKARDLIKSFDQVTFTWVPRAKNKVADHLSNVAMDAAADGHAPGIVDDGQSAGPSAESLSTPPLSPESSSETSAATPATSAAPVDQASVGSPGHWTGASSPPTRLVLLRHGQTAMSAAKQYSGRSNPALSEIGMAQARAAATALAEGERIDAIVTSPLTRARQTAEEAGRTLGLEVEVLEGLTELDFGMWEGKTFEQAHELDSQLHEEWIGNPTITPPGGEAPQALHKRVRTVRRELVERYPGKTVLVVAHVMPIKSLVRQAIDSGPHVLSRMFLELASISVVEFFPGQARVSSCLRSFNDTAHLKDI
ncbi:bifunctional RNase H/acid phosphatase [Corynebacterium alimapuense]|uniref:bifunctional RNase H/acid phosphatase n=1 Tax=Corynebacterium alimapuense TaxID=1576874 RepID=UPI001FE7F701|nr:bifunctional RNase H/acid phosphatase [Corynebacterium alimapuense]